MRQEAKEKTRDVVQKVTGRQEHEKKKDKVETEV
jgi:hypothetical protein